MPLTMLFSTIRLLKRKINPNDRTLSYYIDLIERNSYKLLRQINNIVELSNQQSGISQPNLSIVNINELINDLVYHSGAYMSELGIPLMCEQPDSQVLAVCDAEKIERALLNLLSNAVKFTRPGNEILIKLENDETYFTITIKDKGLGIDPRDLPHIFKPYYSSSHDGIAPGLGIGLSLVENIIMMHKGRVFVESAVGEGSSFIINIPYGNVKSASCMNQYIKPSYEDAMSQIRIEFIPLLPILETFQA
jgi:signal transduction histidine kinase